MFLILIRQLIYICMKIEQSLSGECTPKTKQKYYFTINGYWLLSNYDKNTLK